MSEHCAHCDSRPAPAAFSPPAEWLDYLREERGLGPPIGTITVPLCDDCEGELRLTKEAWYHNACPPLNADSVAATKVRSKLDALDLDRLDDDML